MHSDPKTSESRPGRPAARRVLIGFANALAAIEAAWSLLDAGFEVSAFVRRGGSPPLRRLGGVELHEIAPPEEDAAAAAAALRALVEGGGFDLVMPLDDVAVALCERACSGTGAKLAGPSGAQAEVALDKRLQLRAAAAAGFSVPTTEILNSAAIPASLQFPAVVRPAAAVGEHDGGLSSSAGATTCADRAELERRLAELEEGEALLAQPQLRGVSEGLFGIAGPHGVGAWSAHRRVRMMNPAGSGSSACESAAPDAELREAAARMLATIGWRGIFMVELLRDESGQAWFIELNGRAWGSMALARAAGLEYPAWGAELALGSKPRLPPAAAVGGRRARHLGREIRHALIVLRGARSSAVRWPSRSRTLRDLLRWRRGDRLYNWRGRLRELPLLIDDTLATVLGSSFRRRAKP